MPPAPSAAMPTWLTSTLTSWWPTPGMFSERAVNVDPSPIDALEAPVIVAFA